MEVRHCPRCGSPDVSKSTSSFEYGGSTRWSCEDCDWHYKKGRGMGTGTGNSGVHPRELSGGEQDTLTETGEYCRECETVVKGDHACTPAKIVVDAEEPLPQEEVIERLDEFRTNPERVLTEAVHDKQVALTPTFFRVIEWPVNEQEDPFMDEPAETEMIEQLRDEIQRAIEQEETDPDDVYDADDRVSTRVIKDRMAVENRVEAAYIDECIDWLTRYGDLTRSMEGVWFRGEA